MYDWVDTSRKSQSGLVFPEYRMKLPAPLGEYIVHRHVNYGNELLLTNHGIFPLERHPLGTENPECAKEMALKTIIDAITKQMADLIVLMGASLKSLGAGEAESAAVKTVLEPLTLLLSGCEQVNGTYKDKTKGLTAQPGMEEG